MMPRKGLVARVKVQGLAADLQGCGHVSEKSVGDPSYGHSASNLPTGGKLDQRPRSHTLSSSPTLGQICLQTHCWSSRPDLQAEMYLIQFSAQRHGRWLAALLLLPAQRALSLSDQISKDVDYPVLPLLGPLLTVRIIHLASCTEHAK